MPFVNINRIIALNYVSNHTLKAVVAMVSHYFLSGGESYIQDLVCNSKIS